jgi:hypothetical protein
VEEYSKLHKSQFLGQGLSEVPDYQVILLAMLLKQNPDDNQSLLFLSAAPELLDIPELEEGGTLEAASLRTSLEIPS